MVFDFFFKREPVILPFFTDIHCHVVPGVDDGSPDAATSGMLLERMHGLGIMRVFTSPHVTQDTFENTPETLAGPLGELHNEIQRRKIPIKLYLHAEYRLDEFFIQQKNAGNLTPLPGNLLLVENSFAQEPYNLDNVLFDLRLSDYTPILAHPERYKYYSESHRERYRQLHDSGVLFQINLLSLAGRYGRAERSMALELLESGMADFIGTDIHRESHVKLIEDYLASRTFRQDRKLMTNLRNDEI